MVFAYIAAAFAPVQLALAGSGVYNDGIYLYNYVYMYPHHSNRFPSKSEIDHIVSNETNE